MIQTSHLFLLLWALTALLNCVVCQDAGINLEFVLVNTDTESSIQVLKDGAVIDVATLDSPISIRLDVNYESLNSIFYAQFDLDDGVQKRAEYVVPYLLGGDVNGDYFPVEALTTIGTHVLNAKVYGFDSVLLEELFINFETIDSSKITLPEPEDSAFVLVNTETDSDIALMQDGYVIDIATLKSGISIRLNVDEYSKSSIRYVKLDLDNGVQKRKESVAPYLLGGDVNGDYFGVDALKNIGSHVLIAQAFGFDYEILEEQVMNFETIDSSLNSLPTPQEPRFVLVDTENDLDIAVMKDGYVIDIATLKSDISIRFDAVQDSISSIRYVKLDLDNGVQKRKESVAPYLLGGDVDGDYFGVDALKKVGYHVLIAQAFGFDYEILEEQAISFETIDGSTKTLTVSKSSLSPTPAASKITESPTSAPTKITSTPTSVPSRITSNPTPAPNTGVILGFILVNADMNKDMYMLEDGVFLDIATLESRVSVRLDVSERAEIASVMFNWDSGKAIRTDYAPPYLLGGDNGLGNYYPSYAMVRLGPHVLHAVVYGLNGKVIDEQTLTFYTIDSSVSDTMAPTPTPKDMYDVEPYKITGDHINGELKKWHKITLGFSGRSTPESNRMNNPFLDFRMDVNFTHSTTGKSYMVPGYFACDGDAANTGAYSGPAWLAHFAPDEVGEWTYTVRFKEGYHIAANEETVGVSASFFDGESGTFVVEPSDKSGRDLRGKGMLRHVGKHHLQFAESGEYFLKAGTSSPENLLSYEDFDDTPDNGGFRKSWAPHVQDYVEGDPTWMGGKGKGLIGAINYLASKGVNSISVATMTLGGYENNVYPFAYDYKYRQMDCSKLAQWEVVFEHATKMGMLLHFKTQEQENENLLNSGNLDVERKVYYRELIARFGHHPALQWNIGVKNSNTPEQRKIYIDYITDCDPYGHPIVMQTQAGSAVLSEGFTPLLSDSNFDGASLQLDFEGVFHDTLKWVAASAEAKHPWIVSNDQQGVEEIGVAPDTEDPNHDAVRQQTLWGNIMAGGAGVEYFFGVYEHSDLTFQDFRSRERMLDMSRYALEFFKNNSVPFWDMSNANEVLRGNDLAWCLAEADGSSLIIYLRNGGIATIDFGGWSHESYSIEWYDPRNGGSLQQGSLASVMITGQPSVQSIGIPPNSSDQDWVVLIRCQGC